MGPREKHTSLPLISLYLLMNLNEQISRTFGYITAWRLLRIQRGDHFLSWVPSCCCVKIPNRNSLWEGKTYYSFCGDAISHGGEDLATEA